MNNVDFMQYGYGGLLAVVLLAIGRGVVVLYRDVLKPMAEQHMKFTNSIAESSSKMADSTKELAGSNKELVVANKMQVDLLNDIKSAQVHHICKYVSPHGLNAEAPKPRA